MEESFIELLDSYLDMDEIEEKKSNDEVEELNTKRKYCSWCGAEMVEPQESEDKE